MSPADQAATEHAMTSTAELIHCYSRAIVLANAAERHSPADAAMPKKAAILQESPTAWWYLVRTAAAQPPSTHHVAHHRGANVKHTNSIALLADTSVLNT